MIHCRIQRVDIRFISVYVISSIQVPLIQVHLLQANSRKRRVGRGDSPQKNENLCKYGTKAKKRPSVPCAPSMGRSCGNTMAGRHHWCPDGIPFKM